jgi:aminoglycoside/choline kinase family phosphotransferase
VSLEPITGSGSNRRYFRVVYPYGGSAIATVGTNLAENEAFLHLADTFERAGLPVPHVSAVSADRMAYLQQDLGSTSLYGCLHRRDLVARALTWLPRFQRATGLDFRRCYPVAEMDRRSVMWDLNYFKYCYLKPVGVEIDEPALEDDFESLAADVLSSGPWGFMYRDFQSRNVMISGDETYFIDFQGGRRGPMLYDVVSFLWQARANATLQPMRREMLGVYAEAAAIDEAHLRAQLPAMVLFRMLQVLGAYGFRGLFERKEAFLNCIPQAIDNIRELLPLSRYPYLTKIFQC